MATIFDTLKLTYESLASGAGVPLPTYQLKAPPEELGDHIVINYIPQNRDQVLSNNLVNINIFVNKINGSGLHDFSTLNNIFEQVKEKVEAFTGNSENVEYYAFQILSEPTLFDYEKTNFSLLNFRITVTNNI